MDRESMTSGAGKSGAHSGFRSNEIGFRLLSLQIMVNVFFNEAVAFLRNYAAVYHHSRVDPREERPGEVISGQVPGFRNLSLMRLDQNQRASLGFGLLENDKRRRALMWAR